MEKNDISIDLYLKSGECTMICPGYKYPRDEDGFSTRTKQERDTNNLIKLENTVSQRMQLGYKQALLETLEEKIPILYIDCQQKGGDDIMFFILKEYLKQSKAENKNVIIGKAIGNYSVVTESSDKRKTYMKNNNYFTTEEILLHYQQLLKDKLQANDTDEFQKMILNFEREIVSDGVGKLMEEENKKYLYLYLDKIENLSIDEQQRINSFLYTRGAIHHGRWIRVKINNGKGVWKTRTSSTGHRIQSTHDYGEYSIYEKDL
ncbi:MAG: hypothetical protein NTY80_02185 [candidate division SR1 bacterium]|nr:hypothetical protein [candidate division SR1 bacterium]